MAAKFLLITVLLIADGLVHALPQTLAVPSRLIAIDTEEGQMLLRQSSQADFLPLSLNWDTQMTPSYCGVASACAVLNSLRIPRPLQDGFEMNLTYFTQSNFFENPSMASIITKDVVLRQGFTLEQLSGAIGTWNVSVNFRHAGDTDVETFRSFVKTVVGNQAADSQFLLVNYLRMTIDQQTGGHISPVAAYNQNSDRVLVLDVAKYKYPPVWIGISDLFAAMNTVDTISNKTRGYLTVSVCS